jgi:hypothetical protein
MLSNDMFLAGIQFLFLFYYSYDSIVILIALLFYTCKYLCRHKTRQSDYTTTIGQNLEEFIGRLIPTHKCSCM